MLFALRSAFKPIQYSRLETEKNTGETTTRTEVYDYVCMCTGMYNNANHPNLNEIENIDLHKGKILHSSEFINMEDQIQRMNTEAGIEISAKKSLMVVGGGKSAYDMITYACNNPHLFKYPIHWYIKRPQWIASTKYLNMIKLRFIGYTRFVTGLGGHYGINTKDYGLLRRVFQPLIWRAVELLTSFDFGFNKNINKMINKNENPNNFKPQINSLWRDLFSGGVILDRKIYYTFTQNNKVIGYSGTNNNKIIAYDEKNNQFLLSNNNTIPACDISVFALGFNKLHYDEMFDNKIDLNNAMNRHSDGSFLFRQILPPQMNRIAFIGAEATSWSNILTSFIQSEWLASAMSGGLVFTKKFDEMTDSEQQNEIANQANEILKYKRSFMHNSSSRGASLQLHMIGYHDQLLKDMGLNPKRKSNFLLEMFSPLIPSDYSGIIQEKQEKHRDVQHAPPKQR